MPRKPRFYLPGVPVHVVQRGHSREPVFFEPGDYQAYLRSLQAGAERYDCAVHAYVLMTNHVHLPATPRETDSVSRALQYVGPIHRVTLRPPGSPSKPPLQVVYVFREVNDATG